MKPMQNPIDPFPTVKLKVPYLKEVLEYLRDPEKKKLAIIVHAQSPEEGEWILANVAARLTRSKIAFVGPEPIRTSEIVEQAVRSKVSVALVGEIRRVEDAHAIHAALGFGLRTVAFIAASNRADFDNAVTELGAWRGVQPIFLARA